MNAAMPGKIHYTELPDGRPGSALQAEWEVFRRELPRLLAEGHEGQYAVVSAREVVGLWDSLLAAEEAARTTNPGRPGLVQRVSEWVPELRSGYSKLCRE